MTLRISRRRPPAVCFAATLLACCGGGTGPDDGGGLATGVYVLEAFDGAPLPAVTFSLSSSGLPTSVIQIDYDSITVVNDSTIDRSFRTRTLSGPEPLTTTGVSEMRYRAPVFSRDGEWLVLPASGAFYISMRGRDLIRRITRQIGTCTAAGCDAVFDYPEARYARQ